MVIDIMQSHCRYRISRHGIVSGKGREASARAVGKDGEGIAAEVVLVDATNACKERMAVVNLPSKARRAKGKSHIESIEVGENLHVFQEPFLVVGVKAKRTYVELKLARYGYGGMQFKQIGPFGNLAVGLYLGSCIEREGRAQRSAVALCHKTSAKA